MGVKSLAEAIIIQSLEDVSDHRHRADSMKFFAGNQFRTCARLAGMSQENQIEILGLVKSLSDIPLKMGIEPDTRDRRIVKRRKRRVAVHA